MDPGERWDSPAPACVPCPQPQDGWLSRARRVACPQGLLPAAGTGISIPSRCQSECLHPARLERLGSGSREVVICLGSITADTGRQVPAQPQLARPQRRWAQGRGVSLCWEHSAPGRGKIWWQQRDAPRGGWFSKGWEMGPRSHPRANPADSPCSRGRRKGTGASTLEEGWGFVWPRSRDAH